MRLKDRVAIVTGGGSGIGEATCLLFAEEGARVVVADIDPEGGRQTVQKIEQKGGQAVFVLAHVEVEEEAALAVQRAVETFGSLHILVNNAGMRVYGPITEADERSWDAILGVNVKGVAFCSKAAIPHMATAGGGSIVNISSANAVSGRGGMAQYDATKAAVLALTRSMAVDHAGQKIRVNAICPGPTITQFHIQRAARDGVTEDELRARSGKNTILQRAAEAREIAYGILFLASDEASYVTGSALMVDGGLSAI